MFAGELSAPREGRGIGREAERDVSKMPRKQELEDEEEKGKETGEGGRGVFTKGPEFVSGFSYEGRPWTTITQTSMCPALALPQDLFLAQQLGA